MNKRPNTYIQIKPDAKTINKSRKPLKMEINRVETFDDQSHKSMKKTKQNKK
jgi:hypothetical protein